jgi:hypothetical protein
MILTKNTAINGRLWSDIDPKIKIESNVFSITILDPRLMPRIRLPRKTNANGDSILKNDKLQSSEEEI